MDPQATNGGHHHVAKCKKKPAVTRMQNSQLAHMMLRWSSACRLGIRESWALLSSAKVPGVKEIFASLL
eukprot:11639782-Karenia_brevis.AAC.1